MPIERIHETMDSILARNYRHDLPHDDDKRLKLVIAMLDDLSDSMRRIEQRLELIAPSERDAGE